MAGDVPAALKPLAFRLERNIEETWRRMLFFYKKRMHRDRVWNG